MVAWVKGRPVLPDQTLHKNVRREPGQVIDAFPFLASGSSLSAAAVVGLIAIFWGLRPATCA